MTGKTECICLKPPVAKDISYNRVLLTAEQFCDVRLLWVVVEEIRVRGVAIGLCDDMSILFAVGLSDCDQQHSLEICINRSVTTAP